MEQLFHFLMSVHPISTGLQKYLLSVIQVQSLKRKQFLLKAGHICRNIYFLEKGLVRFFYSKEGIEVSSSFMKENDIVVSVESFYNRIPSYENIQALEDCNLNYISYDHLYTTYREFPEFNWIGRELTQRYYGLSIRQLYGLRNQQATERYTWLVEQHPELVLRVPAKYLASWLGITEVTLSMIKGKRVRYSYKDSKKLGLRNEKL